MALNHKNSKPTRFVDAIVPDEDAIEFNDYDEVEMGKGKGPAFLEVEDVDSPCSGEVGQKTDRSAQPSVLSKVAGEFFRLMRPKTVPSDAFDFLVAERELVLDGDMFAEAEPEPVAGAFDFLTITGKHFSNDVATAKKAGTSRSRALMFLAFLRMASPKAVTVVTDTYPDWISHVNEVGTPVAIDLFMDQKVDPAILSAQVVHKGGVNDWVKGCRKSVFFCLKKAVSRSVVKALVQGEHTFMSTLALASEIAVAGNFVLSPHSDDIFMFYEPGMNGVTKLSERDDLCSNAKSDSEVLGRMIETVRIKRLKNGFGNPLPFQDTFDDDCEYRILLDYWEAVPAQARFYAALGLHISLNMLFRPQHGERKKEEKRERPRRERSEAPSRTALKGKIRLAPPCCGKSYFVRDDRSGQFVDGDLILRKNGIKPKWSIWFSRTDDNMAERDEVVKCFANALASADEPITILYAAPPRAFVQAARRENLPIDVFMPTADILAARIEKRKGEAKSGYGWVPRDSVEDILDMFSSDHNLDIVDSLDAGRRVKRSVNSMVVDMDE